MQSANGEWWREFRAMLVNFNVQYANGRDTEAEIVRLHKEGFTPLATITQLRKSGELVGPT